MSTTQNTRFADAYGSRAMTCPTRSVKQDDAPSVLIAAEHAGLVHLIRSQVRDRAAAVVVVADPHQVPTYHCCVGIVVRRARSDDYSWIVDVIDRHRGTGLSAAARARQGFVQGWWDVAELRGWPTTPGIVLAEVGRQRVGVAISSPPGRATGGPAGRTNELAAQQFGLSGYFLYGPVVVEDAYRRRGVLAAMVRGLFAHASASYAVGVAFIEDANTASMTAHTRLGFTSFGAFTLGGRGYQCLSRAASPD